MCVNMVCLYLVGPTCVLLWCCLYLVGPICVLLWCGCTWWVRPVYYLYLVGSTCLLLMALLLPVCYTISSNTISSCLLLMVLLVPGGSCLCIICTWWVPPVCYVWCCMYLTGGPGSSCQCRSGDHPEDESIQEPLPVPAM